MDRIELVREAMDAIILQIPKADARRHAYLHLYGVAQACALLAMRRGKDAELAVIAGMLHDVYTYSHLDSTEHAHRGAVQARGILDELNVFSAEETDLICNAIYHHSAKSMTHDWLDEILKDADVMQHNLYNPSWTIAPHEQARFDALKSEFLLGD